MENTSKELTRLIELDEGNDFQMAAAGGSMAEGSLILAGQGTVSRARSAPTIVFEGSSLSRVLDVILALGMLVTLLPVMIAVAIAVRLSSDGPVIFGHSRVGQNGKTFKCLKFRSMYDGAEEILARLLREDKELAARWRATHKIENDPRVTPLGKILRTTSLDELPQLFNVLKGEMSLVGPRPVQEVELEHYGRYVSSYLSVRPGVTGLWQVTGRSGTTYRRRVATDHLYIRKKSVFFDLKILFATVPAVIMQRGAC